MDAFIVTVFCILFLIATILAGIYVVRFYRYRGAPPDIIKFGD